MWNDLQFAFRTLRRSPGFTALAILSLALGIGANTAIFSLLYQVILKSLPVRDPQSLVVLQKRGYVSGWTRSDNGASVFSYPMYQALRDHNQVFDGLIARSAFAANFSYEGIAVSAGAELVTGNFFGVLGVKPVLGRPLTPSDDQLSAQENVIVLGYGFWSNHLGQNRAVLNTRVLVNNHPMLVVGIAPPTFHGIISGHDPDFYAPVSAVRLFEADLSVQGQPDHYWLTLFGRLKPGERETEADAKLLPLFRSILRDELPELKDVTEMDRQQMLKELVDVRPAAQGFNQLQLQWQTPLSVLMAMVGLVLLMACVNVANLLIARAAGREREFAIRLAVGATKFHVFRQLLVEGVVLSLAGGLLGWLISGALDHGLLSLIPRDTFGGWLTAEINWTLLEFSIGLSVLTGVLFGMAPAIQAVRPELASSLREKTSGISASNTKGRFRQVLITVQVCLSLLLLIGAGLFTRSLVNLLDNDPGFQVSHLVTFAINPVLAGYTPDRSFALDRDLGERLQSIPGVRFLARATLMPLGGSGMGNGLSAMGGSYDNSRIVYGGENAIGPGYFQTLGIPLIAGREFTEGDNEHSPRVLVLNETFARQISPNGDVVGRHVRMGSNGADAQIVGVVRDSKFASMRQSPERFMYVPDRQNDIAFLPQSVFFLRTTGNDRAVMAAIPKIVKQLDPMLPVNDVRTMSEVVENTLYTDRLLAILAVAFGALATTLAAIGLFGIISYSVTRRTQEFGIRLALGADRRGILKLVIGEIAWLVGIGLIVGLPLSCALGMLVQSQLYGIPAYDPAVLVGATLILIVAAVLAGWIPSLRAVRVEPTRALRYE